VELRLFTSRDLRVNAPFHYECEALEGQAVFATGTLRMVEEVDV
jgi:hypothetical protein